MTCAYFTKFVDQMHVQPVGALLGVLDINVIASPLHKFLQQEGSQLVLSEFGCITFYVHL
jgi:hypothetical protein